MTNLKKSGGLPVGRPTKYKPEYCQLLITHMSTGKSFETFAVKTDVCSATLYLWLEEFPEFLEAYKKAKDINREFWEQVGINNATGIGEGNPATWIFWMKARFGWRDNIDVQLTGKDHGPVEVKLSKEQLAEKAKQLVSMLEDPRLDDKDDA